MTFLKIDNYYIAADRVILFADKPDGIAVLLDTGDRVHIEEASVSDIEIWVAPTQTETDAP